MNINIKKRLRNIELNITQRKSLDSLGIGAEGTLAGETGDNLARWMAAKFNHNFDAYDRAIDEIYNQTHVGGARYHHILDGQHDIWGAFKSVQDVHSDDSWLTEISQASEHLLRDTMSVSGISPFFSLTPDQFDTISNLTLKLGISKVYLADALTINGPELIGGGVALIASLLLGGKGDPNLLSRFSGACLLSSLISANPLLLPIAAGSMAYAICSSENKKEILINSGKGAIISGSVCLMSSLVGGPIWLGCVAGLITAVAVRNALDDPVRTFSRTLDMTQAAVKVLREAGTNISQLCRQAL